MARTERDPRNDQVTSLLRGRGGPGAGITTKAKEALSTTVVAAVFGASLFGLGGYRLAQEVGILPTESDVSADASAASGPVALEPVALNNSEFVGAGDGKYDDVKNPVDPSVHTGASIVIPSIDVDAAAVPMRFVDNALQEPEDTTVAAYLEGNVADIDDVIGTVLIGGHVSDNSDADGVFRELTDVQPGDLVRYTNADSVSRQFRIVEEKVYSKANFPWDEVLDQRVPLRLAIMTCANKVTYASGGFHYTDIAVAYATPVEKAKNGRRS